MLTHGTDKRGNFGCRENELVQAEEKLVGVADSKQEATGGAGKCVWAMACIFFRNDTWYSHQFIPFVYLRWTRIRYRRERKLK